MASRSDYEKRWAELDKVAQLYMPEWRELSDMFQPRRGRFLSNAQETNQTHLRANKLVDSTPRRAAFYLGAGLMAGATSPARPWFKLNHPDHELAEFEPVREWMDEVTRRMRAVMSQSNMYQVLQQVYTESGTFATGAMAVLEDYESVIRCHPFTIGQYRISQSPRFLVDTFAYETNLTVRQLVMAFGYSNCSMRVKNLWDTSRYDEYIRIRKMCEPNLEREPGKIDNRNMSYSAVYYEVESGSGENQFLMQTGFNEFPYLVPRWDTNAEDVYGSDCPGMRGLGMSKALQVMQREKGKAVAKQVNPPLNVPNDLKNFGASVLPGAANYISNMGTGNQGITPIYQVNPDIQGLLLDIGDMRQQINSEFFVDLFLMLSQTNMPNMTATEVAERHEEKLLMLGPVLERMHYELLDPMIDRIFSIMMRGGLLPPPPADIEGETLNVEYVSILAQAQKAIGINSIERFTGYVGGLASMNPDVLDKVDFDQAIDEYADAAGVTPRIIRSDDEAMQMRAARAQQAAQMQAAAMMQGAADTAKTMSETNTSGDNLLSNLGLA